MHDALVLIPSSTKIGCDCHICDPSTLAEVGGSEKQGHLWLQTEFEASSGYERSYLEEEIEEENEEEEVEDSQIKM